MLYIIATPIGNLEDITLRALRILKEVDLIACEDTRRTGILLNHYNIKNQLTSYHDKNKEKKTPQLLQLLKQNKNIALVSDSGTPGISDPGFYLVRECVKNNIQITPIPGPNAAISALICSGLPTDKFTFLGFLPKKPTKLKELILNTKGTIICYESPHRINKTLELLKTIIPDRDIAIARELTKKYEEFIRGKIREIKIKPLKGELVLIMSRTNGS